MRQLQLFGTTNCDGSAEHSASVLKHEIHLLGRDGFGGSDEVAFVFTVFVIHYDDKLSLSEILDGQFDVL